MDKYFYTENTDNSKAAYCTEDGLVQVTCPVTKEVLFSVKLFGDNFYYLWQEWWVVPSLQFVPGEELLVVTYGMGYVYLVDLKEYKVIKQLQLFEEVNYDDDSYQELDTCCYYMEHTRVDFSPSGKYVVIRVRGHFDPQDSDGRSVLFTPDYFRTVFVMDMDTFEIIFTYSYPHNEEQDYHYNVAVIAFSPKEDLFLTGALGKELKIFELPEGLEVATLEKVEWIADSTEIQHRRLVAFLSEDEFVYVSGDRQKEIVRVCKDETGHWVKSGRVKQELVQGFLDKHSMILDIDYDGTENRLNLYSSGNVEEIMLEWE